MPALVRSISKRFSSSRLMGGNRQKKNKMEIDNNDVETAARPSFDAYGLPSYSNALAMAAAAAAAAETAADDDPMMPTPIQMPEMAPVSTYSSDSSSDDSSDDDEADKYGYGEAQPDSEFKMERSWSVAERPQGPSWRRRRATFSVHPQNRCVEDRRTPYNPHRRPSRSSLKGSSPAAAERRRRASVQGPISRVGMAILEQVDPKSVLEVRLPGKRDSIKRRRSITFNEGVAVRRIQRASSLVARPKDLWFQDEEYSSIKRKTRALLRNVDHGTGMTPDGQKYCVRGLERLMGPSREREVTKLVAWDSVLVEQRMQRAENTFCDETLSNMYRQTTARSSLEAARLAQADAMEVASFYNLGGGDKEEEDDDDNDNDCVMAAAAAAAAANFSGLAVSPRRTPYPQQHASIA